MYAIIETGNKQYKITANQKIHINFLKNKKRGDSLVIKNILMIVGDKYHKIGFPFVKNATVLATIVNAGKDERGIKSKKIHVFKKHRRKGYHKSFGHRQLYTQIKINKIILI